MIPIHLISCTRSVRLIEKQSNTSLEGPSRSYRWVRCARELNFDYELCSHFDSNWNPLIPLDFMQLPRSESALCTGHVFIYRSTEPYSVFVPDVRAGGVPFGEREDAAARSGSRFEKRPRDLQGASDKLFTRSLFTSENSDCYQ